MKAFNYFTIVLTLLAGPAALAQGDLMQICVDSSNGVYQASVSSVAKPNEAFDGILTQTSRGAFADGTRLADLTRSGSLDDASEGSVLENLYYSLKHELAERGNTMPDELKNFGDEPRVYSRGSATLLCSSTIDKAELESLNQ